MDAHTSTPGIRLAGLMAFFSSATLTLGQSTNLLSQPAALPDLGFSALRVFGSLILVLALFLGGVWLYRNWQRVALYKGRDPQLNILEVKSLGNRHALYLVAYQQQRFLLASSPAGLNLLTHLPEAENDKQPAPAPSFAENLRQMLVAKP